MPYSTEDITFGQLEEKRSLLGQLRLFMAAGITESQVEFIHGILNHVFSNFLVLGRPEVVNLIQRVTINRRILSRNTRLNNISYLKYPPEEYANYGRCNLRQHSVLYAGFDYLTILSELKPEVGDLITISYWENITEAYMRCFTVVGNQPDGNIINLMTFEAQQAINQELNGFPPNLRVLYAAQIEFLADAFSRIISPLPAVNYLFSAFFAKKLFSPEFNADAINYPSVQQRLSLNNIAIKATTFDRLFSLKEAKEMIVVASPYGETGYSSGTFSHVTGTARETDAEGRLNWVNSIDNGDITRLVEEFGISFNED